MLKVTRKKYIYFPLSTQSNTGILPRYMVTNEDILPRGMVKKGEERNVWFVTGLQDIITDQLLASHQSTITSLLFVLLSSVKLLD